MPRIRRITQVIEQLFVKLALVYTFWTSSKSSSISISFITFGAISSSNSAGT